jgi:putative spermidine/putrescine transport system permease protein
MIWAVAASVNALDPDLENAAASCGAPPVQGFALVTLPALMPGIITGSLLCSLSPSISNWSVSSWSMHAS